MNVEALYHRNVVTAQLGERLIDVAAMMRHHEVSALPVYQHGECVGIITERDLVQAMAEGQDPMTTRVWRYMTPGPVRVWPDTDAADAAELMISLRARHLPVVDGSRVVGMLSIRDLLRAFAREEASPNGHRLSEGAT